MMASSMGREDTANYLKGLNATIHSVGFAMKMKKKAEEKSTAAETGTAAETAAA